VKFATRTLCKLFVCSLLFTRLHMSSSKAIRCFLAMLASMPCGVDSMRRSTDAGEADMSVDMEQNSTGVCPQNRLPYCSELDSWLEEQRAMRNCLPFSPNKIKCRAGLVPTATGFQQWKIGQPCAAYYQESTCYVMNTNPLGKVSRPKLLHGGGKCLNPALEVTDCTRLAEGIEGDSKDLLKTLVDVAARAPEEWLWVPSHRLAVKQISGALESRVSDSMDSSGNLIMEKAIGEDGMGLWKLLLQYCVDSVKRTLKQAEAAGSRQDISYLKQDAEKKAKVDCLTTTNLDLLAPYHPAWKLSQKNFTDPQGINDFADMKKIGAMDLNEALWRKLATLAGGSPDKIADAVSSKLQQLVLTAAERGEAELEWALKLSKDEDNTLVDGVEPVGGERRLAELKAQRRLSECLQENVAKEDVEQALATAEHLLSEAPVPADALPQFASLHTSVQMKYDSWGLEEACAEVGLEFPCTNKDIDAKMCSDYSLPADCDTSDIKAAMEMQKQCISFGLKKICNQEDINEKIAFMATCVEAGLPETCTQKDIWAAEQLQQECTKLGFSESCKQEDVDFAAVCQIWGLPVSCTQDELNAVATTTTTTTRFSHCLIAERTRDNFGVSFGFNMTRCSQVKCQPRMFFEGNLKEFWSSEVQGKKCACTSLQASEASFNYTNWRNDCGLNGCWGEYATRMERSADKKRGSRRYYQNWQRLNSFNHWTAKCVPEEEAVSSIPSSR